MTKKFINLVTKLHLYIQCWRNRCNFFPRAMISMRNQTGVEQNSWDVHVDSYFDLLRWDVGTPFYCLTWISLWIVINWTQQRNIIEFNLNHRRELKGKLQPSTVFIHTISSLHSSYRHPIRTTFELYRMEIDKQTIEYISLCMMIMIFIFCSIIFNPWFIDQIDAEHVFYSLNKKWCFIVLLFLFLFSFVSSR